MLSDQDKKKLDDESASARNNAFSGFLAQPTIRLLISQMPEGSSETMLVLLEETFRVGWGAGGAHNAIQFATFLMRDKK